MKRKQTAPRNPLVAAALFKKAGPHRKTNKAMRRASKTATQRDVGRVDTGTWLLTRHTRVRSSYVPPRLHTHGD